MKTTLHACAHCARRPLEQATLNDWADRTFGGRLPVASVMARISREAAIATECAVTGDSDLVIDQLAMVTVLAYRAAQALDSDLWQQVTVKIQDLMAAPDHQERF